MRVEMTEIYRVWIDGLKDRALTDGVRELKIDFGPGYRVYYTEHAGVLIVLLAGGDKSTQNKDIKGAIRLATNL
jgi:putative addiction module killer protein